MKIRKELKRFVDAMETVLAANDHKDGWEDMDLFELLICLREETRELRLNLTKFDKAYMKCFITPYPQQPKDYDQKVIPLAKAVQKEAIDVANFAMMIWDNLRREQILG